MLTADVDSVLLLLNETLPVFSWITVSQPLAPYLQQAQYDATQYIIFLILQKNLSKPGKHSLEGSVESRITSRSLRKKNQ